MVKADYLTVTKHMVTARVVVEWGDWRRLHGGSNAWIAFWSISRNLLDKRLTSWWKDLENLFSSRDYMGKRTARIGESGTRPDLKHGGIRLLPSIGKSLISSYRAGEPAKIFSRGTTWSDVHFTKITSAICLKSKL